jgi:hypothetical protein
MENSKPWYLSKTLWLQVLGVIAVIVPASQHFIAENLGATGVGWAMINMVLRLISKDKLEIT